MDNSSNIISRHVAFYRKEIVMAVREGKVYVYCVDCQHHRHSDSQCFSPNNMNINHWKHPVPFEKPEDINKKNDCKWFVKPKWYRAFGWGISP